ncbi:hypothetical protein AB0J74_24520 [Asanoa sp. NPDC049573]|uniref:hypothetical protein n=1 Tax=Asanoa sp. NPDC049573 TaxID=3155396 RepID=UPI00342F1049
MATGGGYGRVVTWLNAADGNFAPGCGTNYRLPAARPCSQTSTPTVGSTPSYRDPSEATPFT